MSFWTSLSSNLRPIKRLTPKMVLVGLVTRWRLATWPTSRSPFLLIATTLGVVRLPSLLAMISGLPDCITAIALLVVPKSIPIIFAIIVPPLVAGSLLACVLYLKVFLGSHPFVPGWDSPWLDLDDRLFVPKHPIFFHLWIFFCELESEGKYSLDATCLHQVRPNYPKKYGSA